VQVSPVVQTLLSLQAPETGGPGTQAPFEHVSAPVHGLPSLQAPVPLACVQPTPGVHESVVQGLASSHTAGGPGTHAPAEQVSFSVQGSPSLQGPVLFTCWQPWAGEHESFVQGLPSSHAAGGPLTHAPPAHVSFVVHAF